MTPITRGESEAGLLLKLQALGSKKGGFGGDVGLQESRNHCVAMAAHVLAA